MSGSSLQEENRSRQKTQKPLVENWTSKITTHVPRVLGPCTASAPFTGLAAGAVISPPLMASAVVHVHGPCAASAPFTGLAALAVVGPPLTAGAVGYSRWTPYPRSRGFSLFGLSQGNSGSALRLKPNGGKPRERGWGHSGAFGHPASTPGRLPLTRQAP